MIYTVEEANKICEGFNDIFYYLYVNVIPNIRTDIEYQISTSKTDTISIYVYNQVNNNTLKIENFKDERYKLIENTDKNVNKINYLENYNHPSSILFSIKKLSNNIENISKENEISMSSLYKYDIYDVKKTLVTFVNENDRYNDLKNILLLSGQIMGYPSSWWIEKEITRYNLYKINKFIK